MSGCGYTYIDKMRNAICFEPETDKDLDRLEELLEELKQAGYERRISKMELGFSGAVWLIALEDSKGK